MNYNRCLNIALLKTYANRHCVRLLASIVQKLYFDRKKLYVTICDVSNYWKSSISLLGVFRVNLSVIEEILVTHTENERFGLVFSSSIWLSSTKLQWVQNRIEIYNEEEKFEVISCSTVWLTFTNTWTVAQCLEITLHERKLNKTSAQVWRSCQKFSFLLTSSLSHEKWIYLIRILLKY